MFVPSLALSSGLVAVGGPGAPAAAPGISLQQAWLSGGWIMWVLAVLAVLGAGLLIRQIPLFLEQSVVPRGLLAELLDRIRAGELNEARRLCEDRPCPLSAIALKAFDHLRHAPKSGVALLRDTVEAEGARQADAMLSQVQLMLDVAVIAPMFGLLGTVLGLLQLFGPAASDAGGALAALPRGGMVQALVTTAFGLMVAIPAMACHAWMRRRVTRRIVALESAAAEIVMAVVGRYDR
ncbi:MAG: MotA/TolQ/ExbB proton channel family protein [bacterium]